MGVLGVSGIIRFFDNTDDLDALRRGYNCEEDDKDEDEDEEPPYSP